MQMNRKLTSFAPISVGVVVLALGNVQAAGIDSGTLIMPKGAKLGIDEKLGQGTSPISIGQIPIDWPVQVQKVNGQWLQIRDSGGYAVYGKPAKEGWVRKDDVVRLADALAIYSGQIMSEEAKILTTTGAAAIAEQNKLLARSYWLRGIYWEHAGSAGVDPPFKIALLEFQKATTLDPKLADAWLRQGRMLTKIDAVGKQSDGPGGKVGCRRTRAHDVPPQFGRIDQLC